MGCRGLRKLLTGQLLAIMGTESQSLFLSAFLFRWAGHLWSSVFCCWRLPSIRDHGGGVPKGGGKG